MYDMRLRNSAQALLLLMFGILFVDFKKKCREGKLGSLIFRHQKILRFLGQRYLSVVEIIDFVGIISRSALDLTFLQNPFIALFTPVGPPCRDQGLDVILVIPAAIGEILKYIAVRMRPLETVKSLVSFIVIASVAVNTQWYLALDLLEPDIVGSGYGFRQQELSCCQKEKSQAKTTKEQWPDDNLAGVCHQPSELSARGCD